MTLEEIHELKRLPSSEMADLVRQFATEAARDEATAQLFLTVRPGEDGSQNSRNSEEAGSVLFLALILYEGGFSPTVPIMRMYYERVRGACELLGVSISEVEALSRRAPAIESALFPSSR